MHDMLHMHKHCWSDQLQATQVDSRESLSSLMQQQESPWHALGLAGTACGTLLIRQLGSSNLEPQGLWLNLHCDATATVTAGPFMPVPARTRCLVWIPSADP